MKTKFRFDSKFRAGVAFLALQLVGGLLPQTAQAGSLWRESVTDERGMFADKRARRVGDILTLVVNERIVSNDVLTLESSRSPSNSKPGLGTNLINQFIAGISPKSYQKNSAGSLNVDGSRSFPGNLIPRNQADVPSFLDPANAASGAKNSDAQKQELSLITQMAVQVIDVLPNGNMVIEGIRQMTFSQQRVYASLRGIVRTMDVTAQNTVPSSLVADARIDIIPEGPNTNAIKKGWLQKLDEKITPW